jgi:hypothetical protein
VNGFKQESLQNFQQFKRELQRWCLKRDPRFTEGLFDGSNNLNWRMLQGLSNASPEVHALYQDFLEKEQNIRQHLSDMYGEDKTAVYLALGEISQASLPMEIARDVCQKALDELKEVSKGKMVLNPEQRPMADKAIALVTSEYTTEQLDDLVQQTLKLEQEQPFVQRKGVKYDPDEVNPVWLPTSPENGSEREGDISDCAGAEVSPEFLKACGEIVAASQLLIGCQPHSLDPSIKILAEKFIASVKKKNRNSLLAVAESADNLEG